MSSIADGCFPVSLIPQTAIFLLCLPQYCSSRDTDTCEKWRPLRKQGHKGLCVAIICIALNYFGKHKRKMVIPGIKVPKIPTMSYVLSAIGLQ